MLLARQHHQHGACIGFVHRFAKNFAVKHHGGVGTQHAEWLSGHDRAPTGLGFAARKAFDAIAEAIRERPEVLDCYTTMGEWDFMLRIVTKDIKAYEAFYLDHLSKLPYVQSINSSVTVTVIKETTVLPID